MNEVPITIRRSNRNISIGNSVGNRNASTSSGRISDSSSIIASTPLSHYGKPTFPLKLYRILEIESDNIIRWENNGESFKIVNRDKFQYEIIPKHFKHNNLSSLQRQLNLYGFKCVTRGSGDESKGLFFHPQFRKGNPEEVANIKRVNIEIKSNSSTNGDTNYNSSSADYMQDDDDEREYLNAMLDDDSLYEEQLEAGSCNDYMLTNSPNSPTHAIKKTKTSSTSSAVNWITDDEVDDIDAMLPNLQLIAGNYTFGDDNDDDSGSNKINTDGLVSVSSSLSSSLSSPSLLFPALVPIVPAGAQNQQQQLQQQLPLQTLFTDEIDIENLYAFNSSRCNSDELYKIA